MKKNLPEDDLRKIFKENGMEEDFKNKFLFLDSFSESVIKNYGRSMTFPDYIKSTDEFKKFRDGVEFFNNKNNTNDRAYKSYYSSIKEEFSSKTEPVFRKLIQTELARRFKTIKERLFAIKTDSDWQWVGKLYPSVFTSERQIIFMSVDKFLVLNDTLIERKYMFYNSPVINKAIIFIDEFDATKETMLKNIIQNGLRDKIDYIELFNEIYSTFKTIQFPKELTIPSIERQNGQYKDQDLGSVLNGVEKIADEIFSEYSLEFNHKTDESQSEEAKNFLFQDHRFLSVLNNDKKFILTEKDQDNRYNVIRFSFDKPNSEKSDIQLLLGSLRGFTSWFQTAVHILSLNYMQRKNELREDGEDEYTLESAIKSVLSLFRLKQSYENYLITQILLNTKKDRGGIIGSEYDMSVYDKGFRYFAFEDSPEHAMESRIIMYSFQNTPEKFLLKFCEKAKVIGISATATIPSVIGNYDLEYLNSKMGRLLHYIEDGENNRLQQEFEQAQSGYKNVNINVDIINADENGGYSVNSWLKVFDNRIPNAIEAAKHVYNMVQEYCPDSIDSFNFYKKRYLRIAWAFKEFIVHDDIYSFLCVLTKHPKKYDKLLNLDLLESIFSLIGDFYNRQGYLVKLLDGDEYDQKKDEITNELSRGRKVFVISVYQTIGAGQNLQYKVPRALSQNLEKINDRENRGEKDFDAIYLDRPTNLTVNINSENMDEETFVKSIFQHEFLQENGEIDQKEASARIKKAFRSYLYNANCKQKGLETKSVKLLATKVIIQAVGRICRTNLKSKNIYIYADNAISNWIDPSVIEGNIYNNEFLALIRKMKLNNQTNDNSEMKVRAELLSIRANKFINKMLPNKRALYFWDEGKREQWKKLRNLVMKHPTFGDEINDIEDSFVAKQFYIKLPQKTNAYYYSQSADYNDITISSVNNNLLYLTVSEQSARLGKILSFDGMKDYFKRNEFATEFKPNNYIMSPPMFNNIYKGALGEAVGWYLFKTYVGIALEEIEEPEIFELFDYRIPNTDIYVDFKHWVGSNNEVDNNEIILKKISTKGHSCGSRCVIIANILSDRFFEPRRTSVDGIQIIKCPSLLIDRCESVELNTKSFQMIRTCINEFSNKDK